MLRLTHCAVSLGVLLPLVGCAGSGRIDFAALNYREVEVSDARFGRLTADRCAWWTEESGRVGISMDAEPASWVAPGRAAFEFAIKLDQTPAGRQGEYLVSRRDVQATLRFGPSQERFVALAGVVVVSPTADGRLSGRFRLEATQQSPDLLGGWNRGNRHVLLGEFSAVRDTDGHGRRVAEAIAGADTLRPAADGDRENAR